MIVALREDVDVATARLRATELARAQGFSELAAAELATAVSELARNVLLHGGGGEMRLEVRGDGAIVATFDDDGLGIADVERAMEDGWSSRGSLGIGLPSARRLTDELAIEPRAPRGTRVTIAKRRLDRGARR